jgi:chaperonin GroES
MYDRVLIKRKDAKTQTTGGLYIPPAAQEKSNLAVIVAVGPGRLDDKTGNTTPLKVEPGMTVLIGKWSGDEVKVDDVDHLLIREADILAVVDE